MQQLRSPVSFSQFDILGTIQYLAIASMGEIIQHRRKISRQTQIVIAAIVMALVTLHHYGFLFGGAGRPASARTTSKSQRLYGSGYHGRSSADINRVVNDTLGFSKVFVVGLPERSDKRDAIALTSAATGFHVEFVDGIKGDAIPDKAVPFGIDRKEYWESNLGSWRGHMDAIRRYGYRNIIERQYERENSLLMPELFFPLPFSPQ